LNLGRSQGFRGGFLAGLFFKTLYLVGWTRSILLEWYFNNIVVDIYIIEIYTGHREYLKPGVYCSAHGPFLINKLWTPAG
jgi:hypothetical protein